MKEAMNYLKEVSTLGSILGLDSIKELLSRLGNPEKELKVIHIAGTNGKGSIMTFLQNILMEAGYKVGRYSSPAVFEFREMFQLGKDYISEEEFSTLLFKVKDVCDKMVKEGLPHPTEFEIETAVAFIFFAKNRCDIALIECGMGGETDATNVFSEVLCSIIASISLDHMNFLGKTVEEIARVKAGIIKDGCPVVSSVQEEEILEVIKEEAKRHNSSFIQAGKAFYEKGNQINSGSVGYISHSGRKYLFHMPMYGSYQLKNVATAIEVAELLEKDGLGLADFIEKGIENSLWPGRMEKISGDPLIIIDGAHNPGAVKELQTSIELYFTNQRITFIMGVLADKDFEEEARIIADKAESIYTVTPNNSRGLSAENLAETLRKYNGRVFSTESLEEALNLARKDVCQGRTDMIIAFGSLSYLGELKNIVRNNANS